MPRVSKDIKQEIISLRHNQYFLALLVLLFVCIIVWTSVSIVTSQKETKVSPKLQQMSVPLTPLIKTETLVELELKRTYGESELAEFPIYRIITSQDGRQTRAVPIDTPLDEVQAFQQTRRPITPTATPTPAQPSFPTDQSQDSINDGGTESDSPFTPSSSQDEGAL